MKKFEYYVYTGDKTFLKVIRSNNTTVYEILEDGRSVVSENPIPDDLEPNYQFIDNLSGDELTTIDVLCTDINYDEIIGKIKYLLVTIVPDNYKFEDFSMDISYIFIDYIDTLKQLGHLLEENDYLKKADDAYAFFDKHFFNRMSPLTEVDFEEIHNFFNGQIKFLESIKSH